MNLFNRMTAALTAAAACMMYLPMTWVMAEEEPAYADEVTLYFLDESNQKYLTIPEDLPQSYQITLEGDYEKITYSPSDYYYIRVDQDGIVTPGTMTTIVIGSGTQELYRAGDYTVTAKADGESFVYLFHVVNYANYYAYGVADAYLAEHITEDMTDEDKLRCICDFVASYDYSPYYSSMVSMLMTGEGGDCWASVDTVNYMCRALGYRSRTRNAANDPGAGSGHRNNVVQTPSGYYMVDCGFSGKAPRYYSLSHFENPYIYKKTEDGTAELTEYLSFDSEAVVPAEIDGLTVTAIGSSLFADPARYLEDGITSVTLPDTIRRIGNAAFYGMDALSELYIPASVEEIGMAAFNNCENLTLTIDPENQFFMLEDGILYSKDKKTLIAAVSFNEKTGGGSGSSGYLKKSLVVPEGVEEIADQAFADCQSLEHIEFPSTLRHIGYRAFAYSGLSGSVVLPESLEGIGATAFYLNPVNILVFHNSTCVINDTKENDLYLKENGATLNGTTGHPIFILAPKGSTAEEYAEKFHIGTIKWSDGTEEEELRYVYAEYPVEGECVAASGEYEGVNWKIAWGEELEMCLYLDGSDSVTKLGEDFLFNGAAETLVLSDEIGNVSKSFMQKLVNLRRVVGTPGGYAQELAEAYGLEFISNGQEPPAAEGDCDGDGALTVADAVLLQKWLLHIPEVTLAAPEYADLNGDGETDVFDLALLKGLLTQKG